MDFVLRDANNVLHALKVSAEPEYETWCGEQFEPTSDDVSVDIEAHPENHSNACPDCEWNETTAQPAEEAPGVNEPLLAEE